MKKRILSAALALVLLFALLPVTAQAEYSGTTYSASTTLTYDWYNTCKIIGSNDPENPVVITINNTNGASNRQNSLCVSGYNANQMAGGFTIESGYVKITGGSYTANIYRVQNGSWNYQGPMITVKEGATLTLERVQINGLNQNSNQVTAKCAAIRNFGTLILGSGTGISYCDGNYADEPGGAIYNKGTLNMYSGSIAFCEAINYSDSKVNYGGGIYNDNGDITIYDGMININCNAFSGGGIYMNGGTLVLNGGAVQGTATGGEGAYGALDTVNSPTLTMNGGCITGAIPSTPENAITGTLGANFQSYIYIEARKYDVSTKSFLTVNASTVVTSKANYGDPVYTGLYDENTKVWNFEIIPTGVTLDESSKSLDYPNNLSFSLTATVAPENAHTKTLTWESSNESVATVSGGTVTLTGTGSATITATTFNGMSASCALTVTASHEHSYTTASDESGHWTECACGDRTATEAHTPVTDPAVAATCTAAGKTEGSHCSVCNAVITAQVAVSAPGHSWGTPSYTWDGASCTAQRICSRDGSHKETETVVAAKTVTQQQSCTQEELSTYTAAFANSAFTTQIKTGVKTADKLGHNYTTIVTPPTCTAQGYTTHTCSRCNDSYTDNYVNAAGHTEVIDVAVAATCTATGLTEGRHCSVCRTVIVAQTVVPVLAHDWGSWALTTAASCLANGVETRTCSRCSHSETRDIPATGHTVVTDVAVAATCTKTGLTAGSHCSVCKAVLTAQTTVPALNHDYTAVVTAPTCTAQGYTTHTCSRGDSSYQDAYVDALGHSWGATSYTWNGTSCTAERSCVRAGCDHKETETVTATSKVTQTKTCTLEELSTYTATFVNSAFTTQIKTNVKTADKLGHDYASEFTVDIPATCETAGSKSRHCSRCDSTAEVTAIPATGHDWGVWTSNGDGTETRTCVTDPSHTETQSSTFSITYAGMDGATHGTNHPGTHTYGAETAISDPTKPGYTFGGWQTDGSVAAKNLTLAANAYTADITLTATWALNAPTVTLAADNASATYGTAVTLTATPSHAIGVRYSYEWYKGNNKIDGKSGDKLTLSDVSDSGSYTVKVTASDGTLTSTATESSAVSVTIRAAAHETPDAPRLASKTYHSITVTAVSGQLYFCKPADAPAPTASDSGWNDTGVFTGLAPNNSYNIFTYRPATDANHANSPVSGALQITTDTVKITSVTAPENATLTDYYATGDTAKTGLSTSAACASEDGKLTSLSITWTAPQTYNDVPGETNDFTWSVSALTDYAFATGVVSSGSVTVTNKAATAVNITGTDRETTYNGNPYDVSQLFGFGTGAGDRTYAIVTGGSGAGTLSDSALTITEAGTIKIKVTTAPSGNFAAGEQTATLTVKPASGAGTVSMSGYPYGGAVSTHSVIGSTGAATYYYNTTGGNTGGTEWKNIEPTTLSAGDYWLYAEIAASELHSAYTTAAVKFTVGKVKLTPSVASVTAREYNGGMAATGTIALAAASGYAIPAGETPLAAGTFVWTDADAGTTTVNVTNIALTNAAVNKNYELVSASLSGISAPGAAKISPKALEISAQALTYNGTTAYEVKSYATGVGSETITLTYTPGAKDAGNYTLNATGKGYALTLSDNNYSVESAGTLTVTPKSLTAPAQTVTYNGGAIFTQEVDGVNGEKVTITYTANSKAAVSYAYAKAAAANKYTASASSANYSVTGGADLTIEPLEATLTWSGDGESTYDGSARSVTAAVRNKVTGDTVTVTVSGGDEVNARATAYTATAVDLTGDDAKNYKLPSGETTTYKINPKSISGAEVALGAALTYDGGRQTQTVAKVTIGGLDATFGISDNQQTNAGNYTLTITGSGNFTGTQTAAWSIAQKPLTITAKPQTITYGQHIVTGTEQVEVTGLASGDKLDSITLEPSGSEVAGNKTIAPDAAVIKRSGTTVTDNYRITCNTGVLTIEPATMVPTVTGYDKPYDGKSHGITVTMDGAEINYGTESGTYELTASPTYANVGEYTVYYQVTKVNHTTVTGSATVKITPKALTADMIGSIPAPTYDGEAQTPTPQVSWTPGGGSSLALTAGEDGDFTFSYANNTNAALSTAAGAPTVTITARPGGNYSGSAYKTFTIAPLTAELAWSGDTGLVYDGSDKTVTATVRNKAMGDDDGDFALVYSDNIQKNAGDHTAAVTGLGNPNYALPAAPTLQFTIAKAPISFTVADNEHTYNARQRTATVTQTAGQTPAIAGNRFSVGYQSAGETATAGKTDAGEYAIIVTLTDDNFCFAGERDEDTRSHTLAEQLTIGKKSVTAQWKNLIHVYDGADKTPVFDINDGDVFSDDSGEVRAELGTDAKTAAGTYTVTAALAGTRAANYELTNPTGSLIIQKAPVTFAIAGNSVAHDGNRHFATVTATANGSLFTGFTVSYQDAGGETVDNPTDEGSYDVYAAIASPNHRHTDAADGAARKIGVLTIYRAAQPQTYTVSFTGGEGAGGTVYALSAALSGTPRVLPENPETGGFARANNHFGGWEYGGRVYQPGETLTQPAANITLTAVWIAETYLIEGVVDEAGNPLADVVITLMLGSKQISQTKTDGAGEYSFTDIAPGLYNLVASKNGITKTILVEIVVEDETDENITLPAQKTNSVVEVAAGSPAIVVGELNHTFAPEDVEAAKTGSVEMKLTVAAVTGSEDGLAIESESSGTVGLLLDVTLTKTVIEADGTTDRDELTESPVLLQIVIGLPGDLQGKDSYTVYRSHGGEVQALTAAPNPDGEYIQVNAGKTAITVYAKYFSTYAVAFTTDSATYRPVIAPTEHGSVTVRPAASAVGTLVTITLLPDESYEPASVRGTDRNGKEVALTQNSDGTYSFTQPASVVTITAHFRAAWNPFTDVQQDNWFHDDVRYVYEGGLMQGTGSTTFSPHLDTSRGMIVAILWRMAGEPAAVAAMTFTDVAEGKYYHTAVAWAAEHCIVEGYNTQTFGPEDPITREQMAAILYRYEQYRGGGSTGAWMFQLDFPDANKVREWAYEAMCWCTMNGIIAGNDDGTLAPQGNAERCQVAAILHRFCERREK